MLVYIFIFIVLSVVGLTVPNRSAGPIFFVSGLFLILFMGTRNYVGCDFAGYLNRFHNLPTYKGFWNAVLQEEAGFQFIIASVKLMGWSYMWLNIYSSIVIVICIIYFCRNFKYSLLIFALFFPILIVQLGMSGLRQALAMSILLIAFVQFTKQNAIATFAWVLVAALFHTSAFIFVPIAYLAKVNVSAKKIVVAVLVLGPVAAYFLSDRIGVYSDRYVEQIYGATSSSGALIRFILVIVPAAIFYYNRTKVRIEFPDEYHLLKLFSIISFGMIFVAIFNSIALHRLNYYVMPVSILILIYSLHSAFGRKNKIIYTVIPVLFYGMYSVSWFLTSKHANYCYVPYDSFLFSS